MLPSTEGLTGENPGAAKADLAGGGNGSVVLSFGWSRSALGSAVRRWPKGTSGAVPRCSEGNFDAVSYVVIEAPVSGVDFELSKLCSEVKYLRREVQGLRSHLVA